MSKCTCGTGDLFNATWDAVNRIINDKPSADRLKSWVGTERVSVVTAQWDDTVENMWSRVRSDDCIVGLGSGDTITFLKIDELRVRVPTGNPGEQTALLRDLYVSLSKAFGGEPFSPEWKTLMARLRTVVGKEDQ